MLVAAVVVVAGNWQDIPPALKLGGLVLVTLALGAAAERTRDVVPATARAVAHLAAALTAPVGIAAAAVAGGTWPVCVLAGGVLAAVACDVQARRWRAPLLDGACVIAVGLALVGLAALVPVPVGVLATIAAGGLLAIRRDAAAAALAAAAAASPILVPIAEQRIGDGTLARIGATGDVLAWSAPLVGLLAGGVLAVVAGRRNAPAVAVMALSAPLIGVVTGLATHGVDAVVWLCLPAIVLAALELVIAVATTEPWRGVTRPIADVLAAIGSGVALALPAIAVWWDDTTALPLLLSAAALAMTAVRFSSTLGQNDHKRGHFGQELAILTIAGTGALVIATTAALGWPLVVTAAVAVIVAAVTVLLTGPRWLPALPAMATAAGFLLAADGGAARRGPDRAGADGDRRRAGLPQSRGAAGRRSRDRPQRLRRCGARGDVRAAALGRRAARRVRRGHRRRRRQEPAAGARSTPPRDVRRRPRHDRHPVRRVGGAGVLALAGSAAITWWRTQELWTAHLAAALTIVAVPFGLTAIGATPTEVAAAMLIVAVVLTGTSFVVLTSGPVASAAMTASAVAAVFAPAGASVLVSVAIVLFGIQVALEGVVRSLPQVARAGAGVAAVGTISSWWTSGANDAVLGWLEPYGVTGGDLAIVAVSVLLLVAGAYAGRVRTELTSWVDGCPGPGHLGRVARRRPAHQVGRLERAAGARARRRRRRHRWLAPSGGTAGHRHGDDRHHRSSCPPGRGSPSSTRGCGWRSAVSA